MTVTTSTLYEGCPGTGSQLSIIKHTFTGTDPSRGIYIQAGLHADEHPGLLVIQHLLQALSAAEREGRIKGRITIVPYANPTGMLQNVLGFWTGRFNLANGENFNRNFPNTAEALKALSEDDAWKGAQASALMAQALKDVPYEDVVSASKRALLREAVSHDVVLDLHCDTAGILHLYTNKRYAGRATELAAALGIEVVLLEEFAGGGSFDEACTLGWQWLAEQGRVPASRIPFTVSIELRGQADVNDELAAADARHIIHYLQKEGYIEGGDRPQDAVSREQVQTFPLEGTVHVPAPAAGLTVWKKRPGEWVAAGECIGEIVLMNSGVDGQRVPVMSPVAGRILVQPLMCMVKTGQRVALIAGTEPQHDRKKGSLLLNF